MWRTDAPQNKFQLATTNTQEILDYRLLLIVDEFFCVVYLVHEQLPLPVPCYNLALITEPTLTPLKLTSLSKIQIISSKFQTNRKFQFSNFKA